MKYAADFRQEARAALQGKWPLAILVGLVAAILGGATSGGPEFKINFTGVNILQRWRNFFLIRKDRKRKAMCLMFIVIRVLSQNQYFYLTKRCKMQCIKNILCRRIHNRAAVLFFHKLIQLPVIWFGEFLTDCRKPVVCYHCHNFIHSYLRTETPRSAR